MPLELRLKPNGSVRRAWYGRYEVNGRRYCAKLDVPFRGKPPASGSLKDEGDPAFEYSRLRAKAKLDETIEEARSKKDAARLVERLYENKTGTKLEIVRLDKLSAAWAKVPRKHPPSPRYAAQCAVLLERFAKFVRTANPKAENLTDVNRDVARSFLEAEAARGVTAKTWNDVMKLLRAACKHLLPAGSINPFAGMPTRDTATVFRQPFTPPELADILQAAKEDDFIRPLLVTGICTAMRRGDCCLLQWRHVDLDRGFVTVKTAKTGVTVDIPIFPMLRDELTRRPRGEDEDYVFPDHATMYRQNPDGITWRVRQAFKKAGFADPDEGQAEPSRGAIHAKREGGLRQASLRDFHSLRVTWVTLALTAGVPLELVQKVTGHQTTDIVLKHYFQPGREEFRKVLQAKMPALLSNGAKTPTEEAIDVLAAVTPKTWRKSVARALALLRGQTA